MARVPTRGPDAAFLTGGGDMGAMMRAYDWSTSPLGPPEGWPQSLRTAVGLMLGARQPVYIAWGSELVSLYNDGYLPIIGTKHPGLGKPFVELWAEIWDQFRPIVEATMAGDAQHFTDLPIALAGRPGLPVGYFTFSYTALRDETGEIAGFYCAATETTDKVLAERRRAFILELGDRLSTLDDAGAIMRAAAEALGRHIGADRAGYAEVTADNQTFVVERDWSGGDMTSFVGRHRLDDFGSDLIAAFRAGRAVAFEDVLTEPLTAGDKVAQAFETITMRAAITVPLVKAGRFAAALYAHARAPRRWTGEDEALVREVAERTWSAVQRARAEADLRDSATELQAVLDAVPAAIWIARDAAGARIDGNAFSRRLLRLPEGVNMSKTAEDPAEVPASFRVLDLAGGEIAPENLPVQRAARGEEVRDFEEEVVFDDSPAVCLIGNASPLRDEAGRPRGSVAAFVDITNFKRAERALRESEARLSALNETLEARVAERTAERDRLWELSPDLLAVIDYEGRLLRVNPSWTRVLGHDEERLLTRPYVEILHPDEVESIAALLTEMRASEQPVLLEDRLLAADGTWRTFVWTLSPDPGGEQLYGVGRDVTDERARAAELALAQDALRQSQKMEAMGQLTGGVAHDFNNLLTPIVGSLDMLQRRGIGGEREQRLIAAALQSADKAKTLVQRLLSFARRQPLQATAVDITKLVVGMGDLLGSTTGPQIRIVVAAADDLPPAKADPNQLEMALLNLGVNARDAMPDGGTLRISATAEHVRNGHRSKLEPGEYIRLSVADSGSGMDEATLARAVEPFFSTKGVGKGTGLGLSMVHGLASQLGGALTIDSRPGVGTNVELWLPRSAEAAETVETAPKVSAPGSSLGKALLVDDEQLVRMSTADMLVEMGYAVVEAASAEEALQLVDAGLEPDVLITDHLMPGMDGPELAGLLRTRLPNLRVLIVSGYAETDGLPSDLPRLTKPFRNSDLAAGLAGI